MFKLNCYYDNILYLNTICLYFGVSFITIISRIARYLSSSSNEMPQKRAYSII